MRFIGSKVRLLNNIHEVIEQKAPGAKTFCDVFSGTAAVGRHFKQWYEVYSNDLLYFSYCLQKATIENDSIPEFLGLIEVLDGINPIEYLNHMPIDKMEKLEKERRFFQNSYSPKGGRMYLTDQNALRIDYARNMIEQWKEQKYITETEFYYLVACLVEGIPFVSNIAGTYGAYNKFWDKRSHKKFKLINLPVVSNGLNNRSYNEDGISLLKHISGDILYIDPPYNERQYLPNYHVLETAAKYDYPELRGVTGQPSYDGRRSTFCSKKTAVSSFEELIGNANFKHIFLSYSTDGIMELDKITEIMKQFGKPETLEINYISFRRFKSRSNANTSKLKEMIIYIEKEIID